MIRVRVRDTCSYVGAEDGMMGRRMANEASVAELWLSRC